MRSRNLSAMTGHELGQRARDQRLELISASLRKRIRPACADMPEELFFEMIDRMATIQLKYELRDERRSS
ncbi:MAG: hypothetical protein ABI625_00655 [bacterium]